MNSRSDKKKVSTREPWKKWKRKRKDRKSKTKYTNEYKTATFARKLWWRGLAR